MDQSRLYRKRAEAERRAAGAALPNVREIYLQSAIIWDQMAEQAEAAAAARHRNDLYKLAVVRTIPSRRTSRVSRIARRA